MIGTVSRVFLGFVLACLTAGLVLVLFIMTPGRIVALPADIFPERIGQALVLAALAATHAAIFSAAFVLIAAALGEYMRIRNIAYYLAAGAAIALAGFAAQYASEVGGQPTILNNYAVQAFLTAGFLAGFVYWLTAGRRAGGQRGDGGDDDVVMTEIPPKRRWRDRPRISIPDASMPGTKAGQAAQRDTLAARLAKDEAKAQSEQKAIAAAREAATRPVEGSRNNGAVPGAVHGAGNGARRSGRGAVARTETDDDDAGDDTSDDSGGNPGNSADGDPVLTAALSDLSQLVSREWQKNDA